MKYYVTDAIIYYKKECSILNSIGIDCENRLVLIGGLPKLFLSVSSSCLAPAETSVVLVLDVLISVCDLVIVVGVVVDGSVVVVGGMVVVVVVVVVVMQCWFGRVVESVIPH